jgi:REP element-mobilizing transposase RayT
MQLSCNGYIAIEQWYWLGRQYPYIDLIAFVIMPDHIHGIIHINADYYNNCVGNGRDRSLHHIIIYVKYSYSQKNNKDYCIYKK